MFSSDRQNNKINIYYKICKHCYILFFQNTQQSDFDVRQQDYLKNEVFK